MAVVTVRNLPEETHRALRVRAAVHGRSTEAEIRAILQAAVFPEGRRGIGTEVAELIDSIGGGELDIPPRTDMPRPAAFE